MAYDKVTVLPRSLSVSSTPMKSMLPSTRQKRYNNFNIFFMLERQLILSTLGGGDEMNDVDIAKLPTDVRCYVNLYLPPLCSRYADLALSPDKWFVQLLAKKDKTRIHAKSHGGDLVPFAELTRIIANNYKEMDDETTAFVDDVAKRLDTCYLLWKTNDTREEEVEKSNPGPQTIENSESMTSKRVVQGNIKGNNKKTTSQSSYNNTSQDVPPLITTPHASSQGSTSLGRSINLGTTNNQNHLYQTAFDYYTMATKAQVDNDSSNINQHPPLRFEHPSSTPISSELQRCLPTYMTMHHPDSTTPAPQPSHCEIKMAQLQKELVHAMADRYEAEVKIGIVKAQIMAEEARRASARILELQQQAQNDRMHLNLHHLLSLRQGSERATRNSANGFTTSSFAAAAAIMPPPPFGKTRRNSQEDNIAAVNAVGGWICGETTRSTSKVEREGLDNDDQALIKRRRVVSSSAPLSLPSSFVELRERLSALVNDPQSPTTIVSMTDRRQIQKPSSTYYQRGIQW